MIKFDDIDWIQLDLNSARIQLTEMKPVVFIGNQHGFVWFREKSTVYSFGNNSFGQLAVSEPVESMEKLYKVSCPNDIKDICALNTFTAMITTDGDLYISGLFMVMLIN